MIGIFLDLETNGLNPFRHRTLEIAFKILHLYTGEELSAYESIIYQPEPVWIKSDPTSLQINGFTFQKIVDGKSENTIRQDIVHLFEKTGIKRGASLFICQNPSFDRAFFTQLVDSEIQEKYKWPYHWLDLASMYWALHIKEMHTREQTHLKDGLSKDEIAMCCNIDPEAKPHRAMNGVDHLVACYKKVVGIPSNRTA